MDANTLVALWLTSIMIVLSAMALIGGHIVDKKRKEERKAASDAE